MPDQLELISRVADGDLTRLSPMAHELVDRNVDVLAAVAAAGANIARAATTTIPIVAMERTSAGANPMSAFDPKRTFAATRQQAEVIALAKRRWR